MGAVLVEKSVKPSLGAGIRHKIKDEELDA
jgi:hypothetical protein